MATEVDRKEAWANGARTNLVQYMDDGTIITTVGVNAPVTTPATGASLAAATAMSTSIAAVNNKVTLESRADAAITANDTYVALASPTAAQQTAQVKRLSQECSAIIRLLRNKLDTTAGT